MSTCLSPVGRPAANPIAGKIQSSHLQRLAVVYVRQSTLQQVEHHQESTRLQYALVDRAIDLGWAPSQVLVIDEDQGRSGATAAGRPGFQRLVAEVGLDHIGLVLSIEISRLARSSRDWYQLLEVCGLFATLIGDADGLYDPQTYNDRLLLGLKGTMSEAELHILKQRLLEGKRAKARRGELKTLLPMGYVRAPSGEVVKDPDEQARAVIDTVFDQFARRGTLNGVLRYLVDHQLQLPYRIVSAPQTGQLQWRRPNRATLGNLLHNPLYAGAYVYGRRPTDPRRRQPGRPSTGRTVAGPEQWEVLLKDRLPAYIGWEQFERNLRQLAANTAQGGGVARGGASLLSGRLICGRCGLRMATQYTNGGRGLRYACSREAVDYGAPLCQSLAGAPLDALIARLVLDALQPAALEISLHVADDLEAERERQRTQWHQRLERARYDAERADSEQVGVQVHWAGGHRTHARILRPVARVEQLSDYPDLLARVLSLHQEGQTCPEIARQLNLEHWHPAKRRQTFNGPMVANLLLRQGVSAGPSHRQAPWEDRESDEWTLNELAWQLRMPPVTAFSWLRKGWLQARQVVHGGHRQWLVWADAAELERLRVRRAAPRRWARHLRVASDDTSPKPG
jgi:DNA invertase Pin-like site-specific DNA recombinase